MVKKYQPIGDVIDLGVALVQAGRALDLAAQYGIESKDPNVLIMVANSWLQMSEALTSAPEDEEDECEDGELVTEGIEPIGFGPNIKREAASTDDN